MKVDFNNAISSRLNFKAIGKDTSLPFSTEQNHVADKIAGLLSEPRDEFGGMSATEFYKQNYDMDFLITPASIRNNRIKLYKTFFEQNGKDDELYLGRGDFVDKIKIGTYHYDDINNGSIFNDIDSVKDLKNNIGTLPLIVTAIGLLGVLVAGIFSGNAVKTKAIIENADTLIKKVDTIANDTIDFQKVVKK